jgi:hypothetical protein
MVYDATCLQLQRLVGMEFASCATVVLHLKNTTLKGIFKQITVLLTKSI